MKINTEKIKKGLMITLVFMICVALVQAAIIFTVDGDAKITGKLISTTVNTGQGDYELYAMNQDVESTDAVTFSTVNTGQGANELYAMNQDVESTDEVTFKRMTMVQTADADALFDIKPTFNNRDAVIRFFNGTPGQTNFYTMFYDESSKDFRLKEDVTNFNVFNHNYASDILTLQENGGQTIVTGRLGVGAAPTRQLYVNAGTANVVAKFESTDSTTDIEISDDTTTSNTAIARVGNRLDLVPDGGNVTLGSGSNRAGFTMYDTVDGSAHCLTINTNALNLANGAC